MPLTLSPHRQRPAKKARRARAAEVESLTPKERYARGKAARTKARRGSHGEWGPAPGRRDPIALLELQARTRDPELVPIRYGRMLASPFAFYRGAAAIMAADLSHTPQSGLHVQLCGDAHVSNFGGFASPERRLIFDINDFDETAPGPWEWDVKRLVASLSVAGRVSGYSASERATVVRAAARSYRKSIRGLAKLGDLAVWYESLSVDELMEDLRHSVNLRGLKQAEKAIAKGRTRDSMRAFKKLTHMVDHKPQIASDPPLIVPVEELFPKAKCHHLQDAVRELFDSIGETLTSDLRHLLEGFRYAHLARKVVGVGSVGTQAWIALLLGRDDQDPLFLQLKQADASVLEPYLGTTEHEHHGERVVHGQRVMQAVSDIFLGWHRSRNIDGVEHDYYVRQLWDWKISIEVEALQPDGMESYGRLCGATLARAHARSGDRIAIAGYLGSGSAFDRAMVKFAEAYADQNDHDYALLGDAVKAGRIEAQTGL